MALAGFKIPMKVIIMLKIWMPAPDMYIIKPFIITVLPGPIAISIALWFGRRGERANGRARAGGMGNAATYLFTACSRVHNERAK